MRNRVFGVSASALLALALFFPVTVPAAGPAEVAPEQVTKDFIEALTIVEAQYAGDVDYPRVSKAAISSMLRVLDPHSSYYDREEFEAFRTEQQSQYFGIGATIGARNGKVYILAPFPGTPAARAGLRYGDEIVKVDGKATAGWSSLQVSNAMRGPRGTKVAIQYRRPGSAEAMTAEITRDAVPLPSVTNAYMIAPGVGYIHHARGFNSTSGDEIEEALRRLEAEGMKSLIYDLRGNPGGLVKESVEIASDFLYKGQGILSIRGRSSQMRGGDIAAIGSQTNEHPLVVLVNGGSASASEIVAGALQDHDRALIVGQTSFGKGLVQSPFELGKDSGGLILTTGKYYTPSGRLIQRDYSNTSFYDYITRRGQLDPGASEKREVFRTDAGRPIYGGGGISPDIEVEIPAEYGRRQLKWYGAMFAFTSDVVNGLVPGFESWKFEQIVGNHVVAADEFVVTDKYLDAFKKFVAKRPELKVTAADVDAEREFLRNELRRELVTAHHGIETAEQITALVDPQVQRALKEIPQAERMAVAFRRNKPSAGGIQAAAGR
jgi:carboxyl-terminal processing protease